MADHRVAIRGNRIERHLRLSRRHRAYALEARILPLRPQTRVAVENDVLATLILERRKDRFAEFTPELRFQARQLIGGGKHFASNLLDCAG